jgi:outer membrane protein OmpA-like peptidoglycan-associated protein
MRLPISFSSCLLLVLIPLVGLAAEPTTIEEFTEALTPSQAEIATPENQTPRTRGLGGTKPIAPKPSVAMRLTFALNSAELSDHSKTVLKNLGRALEGKSLRGYVYQLAGHTCDLGTAIHNLDLSRRRALSVQNYLTDNFSLHAQQFEVKWHGESQPLVPNTDEAARRQNRRVVITNTLQAYNVPLVTDQLAVLKVKCHRGDWEETLEDDDTLTAQDQYSVEFKTTADLNVYIYQVDSAGQMTQLFPNPKYSAVVNPVSAQVYQRLPEPGHWFYLDDNTGQEQVILLAAEDSIDDPRAICARVVTGQFGNVMLAMNETSGVKTRGFKVVTREDPADSGDSVMSAAKEPENDTVSHAEPDVFIVQRFLMHQ